MRALRRRRVVVTVLTAVAAGAAIGFAGGKAGGAIGVVVVLVGLWLFLAAYQRWTWRRFPERCRTMMLAALDPGAGPPPDARAVELALADRWAAALTARDADTARELLDESFIVSAPGARPRGRGIYLFGLRRMAAIYPDLTVGADEVRAHDREPGVFWVRFSERGTPRYGPPLDVTWWERWTVGDGGAQVLSSAFEGVTRVD